MVHPIEVEAAVHLVVEVEVVVHLVVVVEVVVPLVEAVEQLVVVVKLLLLQDLVELMAVEHEWIDLYWLNQYFAEFQEVLMLER